MYGETAFGRKNVFVTVFAFIMIVSIFSVTASNNSSVTLHNTGTIGYGLPEVWANSGSVEDIQAAVDEVAAIGGGNVYIPSGTFTFAAPPSVTIPGNTLNGISIFGTGYSGEPGKGTGVWATTLVLEPDVPSSVTMFYVTDGSNVRISGISFVGRTGSGASSTGDVGIHFSTYDAEGVKDFRVDHCRFDYMGAAGIGVMGLHSQGVIDHNDFFRIYKPGAEAAGTGYGYGVAVGKGYQEYIPWEPDISKVLGVYYENTFIEDNYFQGCRHSICGYGGGPVYVARHNIFTEMWIGYQAGHIDAHGGRDNGQPSDPTKWTLGTRAVEVYNNVFLNPSDVGNPYYHWDRHVYAMRGAGGVLFNNTADNFMRPIWVSREYGDPFPQCYVQDLWIWGDTYTNYSTLIRNDLPSGIVEDVHYFLRAPNLAQDGFDYTPYPYPHPLIAVEPLFLTANADGPYSAEVGSPTIHFQGRASGGTPPYFPWHWDFGDGETSEEQNPIHDYPGVEGVYTATLTVTDSDGNEDSASAAVTIEYVSPILLQNGFEDGFLTPISPAKGVPGWSDTKHLWPGQEGSWSVTPEKAALGSSYSLKVIMEKSDDYPGVHGRVGAQQPILYVRDYVLWEDPTFEGIIEPFHIGWEGIRRIVSARVIRDGAVLKWGLDVWDGADDYTEVTSNQQTNPMAGQWHCIEVVVNMVAGEIRMWIDGVELTDIAQTGLPYPSNYSPSAVLFGNYYYAAAYPNAVYHDSIICSTEYIGPEEARL